MTPPVPPTPAKKSNVLLWVLLGVGGFFFLIVGVVVAGGLFLAHKVKEGHFEMKSADGSSVQIGGAAKIPSWLPDYPGSSPQSAFSAQGREGRGGTFIFKTRDSADHVATYYREQLEGFGLTVAAVVTSGASQVITAEDQAKHHTVTVVIGAGHNETAVNVTYASK
ncbi:MAG: hypothetical protein ABSH31_02700 [Bryobacteraceae bacterium]|jgi:hypothetical protein